MKKKIKGQKLLDIMRAMLNMEKKGDIITANNMDLYWLLTGNYTIRIAKAIEKGESLENIKELAHRAKSRLSFSDLLNRPVLDPNAEIPKDIYNDIVVSKWMVSRILVGETTTLYDICVGKYIENRNKGNNKEAEHYKEVFEFLLTQNQKKENFAELAVKLVGYAESNPKFAAELFDVIENHGINLNQNVFVSKKILKSLERSDANNNDAREPSVSSSNSQIFSSDRITELCRYSEQQEQKRQVQGETVTLGEFLDRVKTSENQEIAAFAKAIMSSKAEAIMPSERFVDLNVTQPKERQLA